MTDEQHQSDAGDVETEQPEQQETVWIGDREFRYQPPQTNARLYRFSHLENKVVPV